MVCDFCVLAVCWWCPYFCWCFQGVWDCSYRDTVAHPKTSHNFLVPPLRSFLKSTSIFILSKMAFAYPKFNGVPGKDVASFLERLEMACISNLIDDLVQTLRLLQFLLERGCS